MGKSRIRQRKIIRMFLWIGILSLLYSGMSHASGGEVRALLVGRGDYGNNSLSPGPENDAKNFKRMLVQAYGEDEIAITEKSKEGVTSVDEMTQSIQSVFKGAGESDVNYFYFSGHGNTGGLNLGSESMSAAQLVEAFKGIGGTHILVIDCCYSGKLISKSAKGTDYVDLEEDFADQFMEAFEEALTSKKRSRSAFLEGDFHIITASSGEEESYQATLGENKVPLGVFTSNLVYGGGIHARKVNVSSGYEMGIFPADYNKDVFISFDEIYQFLQNQVYCSNVRKYPEYDSGIFLPGNSEMVPEVTIEKAIVFSDVGQVPKVQLSVRADKDSLLEFSLYKGGLWELSTLMMYCFDSTFPSPKNLLKVESGTHQVKEGVGKASISLSDTGITSGNYVIMAREKGSDFSYMLPVFIPKEESLAWMDEFEVKIEEDYFFIDGKEEKKIEVRFGNWKSEEENRPYVTAMIEDSQGEIVKVLGEEQLVNVVYNKAQKNYSYYKNCYWNGKDESGTLMEPGNYKIRIAAMSGSQTKEKEIMVLVTGWDNPLTEIRIHTISEAILSIEGEKHSLKGVEVFACLENGQEIPITQYLIPAIENLFPGRQEIVIEFQGFRQSVEVEVRYAAEEKPKEEKPKEEKPKEEKPKEDTNGIPVSSLALKANGKSVSKKIVIGKKEKIILKPIIKPSNATTEQVSYKTSNKKVATVTSAGVLKGKGIGSAVITAAASNGKTCKLKVTVKKAPVKITLPISEKKIKKGKSFRIKEKLPKKSGSYQITYTSSNKKAVTVTSKGKVTGKKRGSAVITVKTFNKKKAKIKVKVV